MENRVNRDMILWFFLALFIVSIIMLGWLIRPFISIIILASVVTGIFSPVFNSFKNKINASAASLLTCMIIFIILFIPIVFFVGILSKEAYDLYLTAKTAVLSDQIKSLFRK